MTTSLKDFINTMDVEYTNNRISDDFIKEIEKSLGVAFGNDTKEYVLNFGYLAYKYIELYGVNSKQMLESDMVKQTKYLHEYFPKTRPFIALENMGDGYYVLVSSEDEVYEYSSEDDKMENMNIKLFDYVLRQFKEIDE